MTIVGLVIVAANPVAELAIVLAIVTDAVPVTAVILLEPFRGVIIESPTNIPILPTSVPASGIISVPTPAVPTLA